MSEPALTLLDALANDGESPLVTLKRILRERDDLLRKLADGPAMVQMQPPPPPPGPSFEPQHARPGLDHCIKHARGFRGTCSDCAAEDMDARGAAAIAATTGRSATQEPEPAAAPKRTRAPRKAKPATNAGTLLP